ncbi:unnamed protein product [Rotaria magnacalcarata]|uniref:Uncharacterized protein n=4 Tax=Rotaria magnacalcarata TaxID=392030 RepID=A0A816A1Z3_9BILA|nr:unnamed protein product [Rotaria magnacalcarata]
MNLVNIAKHLLYLTQTEFHFQNSTTSEDEVLTSQHLFEILKTFKDSYFNELHTYESLDFQDEYDEMKDDGDNGGEELIDEKESTDEEQNIENYEENQHLDIQNNFKLNEMKDIVEWVGQHPNYKIASIKHRFRKVKHMRYIERFREYIEANGTRLEKLKRIKEFMWNEFYVKRTIEKTAIQKARELDWNNFKASESFIAAFKREHRISSGRAVFPHQDRQLLILPEGSTPHIQPQDLSLFRSWRFIHEKTEHYVHINQTEMNLNHRQYFINMHSIIHNQLSAPQFKNLIKSGFVQAKILNETVDEIKKPKDVCFKLYDLDCSVIGCE